MAKKQAKKTAKTTGAVTFVLIFSKEQSNWSAERVPVVGESIVLNDKKHPVKSVTWRATSADQLTAHVEIGPGTSEKASPSIKFL